MDRIINDKRFDSYFNLLVEWNNKFNLTAITDRADVYLKHFYDSILGAEFIKDNSKVVDIGSGAGFPSIPLKLINNSLDITMVDSVNKKVMFLNTVIAELGLTGIRAIHTRAEDIKQRDYDIALARAVAPLNILCEYTLPFLKIGGAFIAYKSNDIDGELALCQNAIKILGGELTAVQVRQLDEQTQRKLVIIKKVKPCPPIYPRSQNKPRTQPL